MFSASLFAVVLATLASASPFHSRQDCADVTVVFARATTEVPLIGTLVGPPFQSALQSALGGRSLNFVGVDYPATVDGFLAGGDPQGVITMTNDVTSFATSCPNTAIVMSGYSQGAQLVHLAADRLSDATKEKVASIVNFGDPDNSKKFPGRLNDRSIIFCHDGDNVCEGGTQVLPPHLSYGNDTGAAAAFVVDQLQKIKPGQ